MKGILIMWKVTPIVWNAQTAKQVAVGYFGSDDLPEAYLTAVMKEDFEFFISCTGKLRVHRAKDGRFYRKKDAELACKNLEAYSFAGGMFLRAKHGWDIHGIMIEVEKG